MDHPSAPASNFWTAGRLIGRTAYRVRQFWRALAATRQKHDLAQVERVLSPPLASLFKQMQPDEQAHSLHIFQQLLDQRQEHPDLLAAALLHDVGKTCHPLRLWERVLIVLGQAFFSNHIKAWGRGAPRGWKRPFVIAEQHPTWGAEMVRQAGASELTVSLIQRHQDRLSTRPQSLEDRLLDQLQLLDDES